MASSFGPHLKPPLVDFDIIQEYIIPRKAFFNRFLTVNTPDNKHSILGYPVCIPHERYHRNEFIFNFGLVVESDCDFVPYEKLVRRLAVTFAEMERQNSYLSTEGKADDGRRPIESLLEIVKEDLNNYGECMIPVGRATPSIVLLPPSLCLSHRLTTSRRGQHAEYEAVSLPSPARSGSRLARSGSQDEAGRDRGPDVGPDAAEDRPAH